MAAEDYLPDDWQSQLDSIYNGDFLSPTEAIQRVREDEMSLPELENVKCPDCDGPMVSRKGQYGTFWGCKSYPQCKGTRDSMGRSKADREEYKRKKAEENGEEYESDINVSLKKDNEGEYISFNKGKK